MIKCEKQQSFLNIVDYAIISLFSCGLVCFLYKFLYNFVGYKNLKDFYVGYTIYENHNKYLDIGMVFMYFFIFFGIYFLYKKLKKQSKEIVFKLPKLSFTFDKFIFNHKNLIFLVESCLSFLYVFLHPFNGQIYLPVIFLIIFLVVFSIYHSFKNLYKKDVPILSIFPFIPMFILLFGHGYNTGYDVIIDNNHTGEQLSVFYMHNVFNLHYYKDIMLVHGFEDVISAEIGTLMFGKTTLYNFILGRSLFDNILVILTSIFAYYIFEKNPVCMSFSLFRAFNIPQFYILSFLILLKKSLISRPFVFLCIYEVLAFFLLFFRTTFGTFWLCASLPIGFFMIFKLFKTHKLKVFFALLLLLLILFFNRELIYYYSIQAINYVQGNLYNFGNDFPKFKFYQIFSDIIKLFAIIVLPVFFIKLCEEFQNKEKNIQYIFILIFSIIFTITSLNYSLGRIDDISMIRIRDISMSYLGVIIPYLALIKNKYINEFKYLAIIFFIIITFQNIPHLVCWFPEKHIENNSISQNIGEIKFNKQYEQNLKEIVSVVNEYSKNENDFLDLTSGMNYFYLNKKMPILYTSYYNVVNSKQNKQILDKLKHNSISVILISTEFQHKFDDTYPSLKLNEWYKYLLTNEKYYLLQTPHNTFLIKNDKKISKENLQNLDLKISTSNLKKLPDVWGNSLNTLNLEKIDIKYKLLKTKNGYEIIFKTPQKGKNIDVISFKSSIAENYVISIDNSNSFLYFKSNKNKIAFPFNNFPSWLLCENINKMYIKTISQNEITDIEFYRRKNK